MAGTAVRAENSGEIDPLHVGEITFFARTGGGGVTVFRPSVLDGDSRDRTPVAPAPDTVIADA